MKHRASLLVLVAFVTLFHGCLYDKNGDGVIRLRLIGDSLTKLYIYGIPWGTGETLKTMLPANWDVANLAEPGRRLIEGTPPSCWTQAEQAIADGADGVVLACGTNDLGALGGTATANTLLQLKTMLENAGLLVFFSSIPPRGNTPEAVATWAPIVGDANSVLLATPGVMDLTSDYDSLDTACYWTDGVHFNELCNVRRACTMATQLLARVPAACVPENFTLTGANPPSGTYSVTWKHVSGVGGYKLTETIGAGAPASTFIQPSTTSVSYAGKPAGTYQYTLAACWNADGGCGGTAGPLTVQVTGP